MFRNVSRFLTVFLVLAAFAFAQGYTPNQIVTAEQLFGAQPWVPNPTGNGPTGPFTFNPQYFATQQTASLVASMLGGTVTSIDWFKMTPGDPFTMDQPVLMVELPGGAQVNPGLVAGFFTHGYPYNLLLSMLQNEVAGVESATSGAPVSPASVTINFPVAPAPAPVAQPGIGSFGTLIPNTNPPAYNMVNPVILLDGKTNVQFSIPAPDGHTSCVASVWSNALLASVIGRWTCTQ